MHKNKDCLFIVCSNNNKLACNLKIYGACMHAETIFLEYQRTMPKSSPRIVAII